MFGNHKQALDRAIASLRAFAKAGFKESFVTLVYEDKGKRDDT